MTYFTYKNFTFTKIYGWEPEFYTEPVDGMPQELKDYINDLPKEKRNQIWVSCDGQDPVDTELLGSGLEYYPKTFHGFPGYFYPYVNTPGYLSPLVAVRLLRPQGETIKGFFYLKLKFSF